MSKKKTQKDKHREKTGALFLVLAGIPALAAVSAVFAFAGFLYSIPYLNLASAVLLTPAACALLLRLFTKNARMEPLVARALTAFASLPGAYIYVCVVTGTLSGVFGAFPVETVYMREVEPAEFLAAATKILGNAVNYIFSPGLLWQDISAWGGEGWHLLMAAALIVQAGLPQLLIKRRPGPSLQP